MKPPSETRRSFNMVGMLVVAAGTVSLAGWRAKAEPKDGRTGPGKVVARVDGTPIYEKQLKPELERSLRIFRRYGMRQDDAALVKRLRRRILDRMIGEQLIYRESRKLSIRDVDQRIEHELKSLQMKYGTGERFAKYLKSKKLTMKELRESLRAKVHVAEYLRRQGILEPEIPETRIRKAYEENPGNYAKEETIKVSHILIALSGHPDAKAKQAARQKAERIRREILAGADFAELAKQYSACNSASGGGSLGYIKKGFMPAEFDQVAFALKKGAVSKVVETRFGFHIIKVFDKKPAGVAPYEDVRKFIKKFLQQEESKTKLAAHIAELKKKAKIEILVDQP